MPDSLPAPSPEKHRVARALGVAGLLIVAITLALAVLLYSSYHSTVAREQTNLQNLATAYAAQTHYGMLALDPAPGGPAEVGLGQAVAGGQPAPITLTRSLPAEAGGALNTVVVETEAAYFLRIFAASDLGSGGSVTLLRRDGLMLVRSPHLPGAVGHSFWNTPLFQAHLPRAPVGAFEATSPTDGKRRLYGYSTVKGYPLVIITGRDKDDTLAVWRGWLWVGVLAWALLSGTLVLLAWRIGREAARQSALIARLRHSENRLTWLADFDSLTGLPNQNRLRRALSEATAAAAFEGGQLGLVLVALERLHEVGDLLGHEAGDDAVRQVAARLRRLAPRALAPARVKTNEFGLLLRPDQDGRKLDEFAFEVHALLSEPVCVHGREFHLEPVVGVAAFPQDASSVNELMRLADIAKHHARGEVGEPVHFHSDASHSRLDERLLVEEQLRRALERGEFSLYYQPKAAIGEGGITGFEVLLRWQNPLLGNVSPARFVPIAEQTGLIVPIGGWVLRTACKQASAWRREHGFQPKVAVNLSIRQFYHKDLLRTIEAALAEAELAPGALQLEITESIAMSGIDVVERLVDGIRALGVELAIDDFGTGYSSLAYLKRFPVQCLKIDRAFVHDLGRDADSAAIVRAIVALGHGLNMRIVAEGVETDTQLAMLRELGCDEFQGYLCARPLDAAAVPALLAQDGRIPASATSA